MPPSELLPTVERIPYQNMTITYQELIDAIENLPIEEQESLFELIHKRRIEKRRVKIATNAGITFDAIGRGKAKRGKSTLINALLGRRDDLLAPVDQLPASNVLCRFVRQVYFYFPRCLCAVRQHKFASAETRRNDKLRYGDYYFEVWRRA